VHTLGLQLGTATAVYLHNAIGNKGHSEMSTMYQGYLVVTEVTKEIRCLRYAAENRCKERGNAEELRLQRRKMEDGGTISKTPLN
jgi:hypothetical protein